MIIPNSAIRFTLSFNSVYNIFLPHVFNMPILIIQIPVILILKWPVIIHLYSQICTREKLLNNQKPNAADLTDLDQQYLRRQIWQTVMKIKVHENSLELWNRTNKGQHPKCSLAMLLVIYHWRLPNIPNFFNLTKMCSFPWYRSLKKYITDSVIQQYNLA